MHYTIATILQPIEIENMGEYTIKYDDLNYYSVWFKQLMLLENITLNVAKEFCKARINRDAQIVFVFNTYFLNIRGETWSKYMNEKTWHRRYHFPWIGFYPIPQKIEKGTLVYESLINEFVEEEKNRRISVVYKSYFAQKKREKFNRI
ncbi:hypothetical protein [Brevibacillus sp. 179-C9.3 HS]|uniref:hypothetical protein n=1 Tax=unclassified Brevibacillus TaxID=2684853 RepID=UPI0039A217E8